jgi:preprotein translocase subunit SecG
MPAWISRALPIAQIAIAVVLMVLILIQGKGSGLSGVFGGEGNIYRTKRGAERVIFVTTIVMAVLFFLVALSSHLLIR